MAYAELHCHTNFSFLDGASAADELVERALAIGLSGLAVTDHNGLYGVVRFAATAREAGLQPVLGVEIELLDPFVPDPGRTVVPARRPSRRPSGRSAHWEGLEAAAGRRPALVDDPAHSGRGHARPAPSGTDPAARPARAGQGGSPGDRRWLAWTAPRPAGSGCHRLPEPVPADQPGQPGRHEGRAAVQPGPSGRARRRPRRAVRMPRWRARPAAAGGRSSRSPAGRRRLRPPVRRKRLKRP